MQSSSVHRYFTRCFLHAKQICLLKSSTLDLRVDSSLEPYSAQLVFLPILCCFFESGKNSAEFDCQT